MLLQVLMIMIVNDYFNVFKDTVQKRKTAPEKSTKTSEGNFNLLVMVNVKIK